MATPENEVKKGDENEMESKGIKRPAPDSTSDDPEVQVQSANEWEKVKLGDQDRKNKFLRLMGANKKEHHGRFVIGQNKEHGSKADTTGHLVENIEAQFNQSMEHKMKSGYRGHLGLGFQKEDDSAKGDGEKKEDGTEKEAEESQCKESQEETTKEGSKEEQDAPDSSSSASPPAIDKYKSMGFVKSNS